MSLPLPFRVMVMTFGNGNDKLSIPHVLSLDFSFHLSRPLKIVFGTLRPFPKLILLIGYLPIMAL